MYHNFKNWILRVPHFWLKKDERYQRVSTENKLTTPCLKWIKEYTKPSTKCMVGKRCTEFLNIMLTTFNSGNIEHQQRPNNLSILKRKVGVS